VVYTAPGGEVITFDKAGRLYAAFLEGRFHRRGVDGRMVEKFTAGDTVRRRMDPAQARRIVRRALELAQADAVLSLEELETDAARFKAVYAGPVPILPPDLYRALVLQATVGCAYNACRFCHLYRDRPFRTRGREEFSIHARAVARLFGAGISMRRGLFLGDADALLIETDHLEQLCDIASGLPPAAQGIFCFGALFGEPRRSPAEWDALRAAGLRRVYLGIETGNDALRRKLNKPGSSRDALRLVEALKRAGIAAGLIFLLGAGGEAFEADHLRDSAALAREADLGPGDFVYLSPLVTRQGRIAPGRFRNQEAQMRAAIGEGPRVAVYDIRAFVY